MPLEIRELVIKVNVTGQPQAWSETDMQAALRNVKEEWIERCAQKVLSKIEKTGER